MSPSRRGREVADVLLLIGEPFSRERIVEELLRSGLPLRLRAGLDAARALELAERVPPDVVLIEARAPGGGLSRLLNGLSESDALRRLPVFVIGEGALPRAAAALASIERLPRPFRIKEFESALRRAAVLGTPRSVEDAA